MKKIFLTLFWVLFSIYFTSCKLGYVEPKAPSGNTNANNNPQSGDPSISSINSVLYSGYNYSIVGKNFSSSFNYVYFYDSFGNYAGYTVANGTSTNISFTISNGSLSYYTNYYVGIYNGSTGKETPANQRKQIYFYY